MKKTYVPVRMPDDIAVRVKKMAGDQGRSLSETIVILVIKSLESGPVSSPGMDLEMLKKAIGEERDEHEGTRRALAEMGLLPDPPNESGLSLEVVLYQVETLARIEFFLKSMTEDRPGGAGKLSEWGKNAKPEVKKVLEDLKIQRRV